MHRRGLPVGMVIRDRSGISKDAAVFCDSSGKDKVIDGVRLDKKIGSVSQGLGIAGRKGLNILIIPHFTDLPLQRALYHITETLLFLCSKRDEIVARACAEGGSKVSRL